MNKKQKKYNDLKKQVQLQRNKKRIVTCCIASILVIIATISIITNYQEKQQFKEYKINTLNEYKELMKDIERKKCKLNELEKQKNNLTQEKNNLTRNKEMLQSDIKKKLSNLES
jgi:biopolymer transport protein ExbB/TolQ